MDFEKINFGLGLLGSVLGIIITIRQLWPSKFKIRIRARYAHMINVPNVPSKMISIDIINLNEWPIYLEEVGYNYKRSGERASVFDPFRLQGKLMPIKLEPRESITAYADIINNNAEDIYNVGIKTSCGEIVVIKQRLSVNLVN